MKNKIYIATAVLSCGLASATLMPPSLATDSTPQQAITTASDQASLYSPQYDSEASRIVLVQGQQVFSPPLDPSGIPLPEGTSFSAASNTPGWIHVGPDGYISASPTYTVAPGTYTVDVLITYPDGSVDTASQQITVINDYYHSHVSGNYFPTKLLSWGQEVPSHDLQVPDERGVVFYSGSPSNPSWLSVSNSGWISGKVPEGTRPGRYDYQVTAYSKYNLELRYDGTFIITEPEGQEGLWYPEDISVEPQGRLAVNPPTFANGAKAQGIFSAVDSTPSWVAVDSDGSLVLAPEYGVPSGNHEIPLSFIGQDGVERAVHLTVHLIKYSDLISVSPEQAPVAEVIPGASFSSNLVITGNGGSLPAGTTLSLKYSNSDISSVSLSEDGQQIHVVTSTDARISTRPWGDSAYLLLTYPDGSQDSLVVPYRIVAPPVPEATPAPSSEPVTPTPEETPEVAVPTASAEPTVTPTSSAEPSVAPTPTGPATVPTASAEPSVAPTPAESTATPTTTAEPTPTSSAESTPTPKPVESVAVPTTPADPAPTRASQLPAGSLSTRSQPLDSSQVAQANAVSQTAQLSEASSSQAAIPPSSSGSTQQSAQPALARTGLSNSSVILSIVGAGLFFAGGLLLLAVRRQARSK